jgi:hypothetical protein
MATEVEIYDNDKTKYATVADFKADASTNFVQSENDSVFIDDLKKSYHVSQDTLTEDLPYVIVHGATTRPKPYVSEAVLASFTGTATVADEINTGQVAKVTVDVVGVKQGRVYAVGIVTDESATPQAKITGSITVDADDKITIFVEALADIPAGFDFDLQVYELGN